MNLFGWCCQYALYVGFINTSWQSCTGDAAPRVVNMHGGKGGVHVQGGSVYLV